MDRLKKMFSGMIGSVKEALNIFPLTILIIFVLTLIVTFFAIDVDLSDDVEELIKHIILIGNFTAFGSWFSESIFREKLDTKRIIGYVISFLVGILFDRLLDAELDEEVLVRWIALYFSTTFLGAIYVLMKNASLNLEKYVLTVYLNIKRTSIIYGILVIGFLILYAIFVALILEDANFSICLKIISLFTGFYYMPVVLKSFANEEAEDTKFNKTVFSKVLLPLLLLAMLIVYIYLVKIFLITEVPKNQLFTILSMIFVCAFPIYIVNKNYMEKGTFTDKVNKAIPYLFTPFIFLQIYSMGIRIKEYGLTESRYMAIVLIIFEVIAIVLAVVKNSKYLRELVLATLAIAVVVLVTPFNYEDMPLQSQKKIVDKFVVEGKEFDSLDEAEKRRVAGAYQYIRFDKDLINSDLSQLEEEKLSTYSTYRYSYNYEDSEAEEREIEEYVRLERSIDTADISQYSKLYEIPSTYADYGTQIHYARNQKIIAGRELIAVNKNGDYDEDLYFDIDLQTCIDELIAANNNSSLTAERVFEELPVISINENRDLYLTEISFGYYKSSGSAENVRIEGFVFEK